MSLSKPFLLELCVLKSVCLAFTLIKICVNAHVGLHIPTFRSILGVAFNT